MNTRTLGACLLSAVALLSAAIAGAQDSAFATPEQRQSYAIGVQTARSFKRNGVPIDIEMMKKGLEDGMSGDRLLLTEAELRSTMNGVLGEMRRQEAVGIKQAADANRRKGAEFLAANKLKPGVVTLPNGVQYRVVKQGNGPKPTDENLVTCKYRGTLLDGREYDATAADKAVTLRVDQMFLGWKETVKQMPVGSRWEIIIPSNLAFGSRGVGSDIGPNETLRLDFELLAVK